MRCCVWAGVVWAVVLAATPTPLRAADPAHAAEPGKEHAGAGGHPPHVPAGKVMGAPEGLFKGAIELSLWTIVVFVLLLLVLRQFAWGPILEGLRTREEGIARDKAEAEHARRLAAEVRQRAEEELARVLAQNTELVNKAKQDAAAQAAEELARGRTDLQGERDRLRRELAIERDQALADMLAKTANLATLISRKVIGRDLSHDDHHRLLDEALAEFRAAGMKRVEDLESARA